MRCCRYFVKKLLKNIHYWLRHSWLREMAEILTTSDAYLVIYDLIKRDPHYWNINEILNYMKSCIKDPSKFPMTINSGNVAWVRTRFNNRSFREKWRKSCARFRSRIKCDDSNISLFEFIFSEPTAAVPEPANCQFEELKKNHHRIRDRTTFLRTVYHTKNPQWFDPRFMRLDAKYMAGDLEPVWENMKR